MAKYVIEDTTLTGIANAIRGKEGSSSAISVNQYANRINNLPEGGAFDWIVDGTNDATSAIPETVQDDVKTIRECAFYQVYQNLSKPKYYIFPNLEGIKSYAFYNNTNILTFTANSQNLNFISDNAFYGCSKMTTFSGLSTQSDGTVAGRYLNVGTNAFCNCSKLVFTDIYKITTLGNYCFKNCSSLVDLHFHGDLTIDGGGYGGSDVFSGCSSLETFRVDGTAKIGATSNGNGLFPSCSSLTDLKLLGSGNTIGRNAFKGITSLKRVVITQTPSVLHSMAFINCTGVTDCYVSWSEGDVQYAPWGMSNATIHYDTQFDSNGEPITS